MLQSDCLSATRNLFVNRYRVLSSNKDKFFTKKFLFLVFQNNFHEITNTNLFY